MGDSALRSGQFIEELDNGVPDHQDRCPYREKAPDVDIGVREIDRECEQNTEDRTRSSEQYDSVHAGQYVDNKGENSRQCSRSEIEEEEFPAAHPPFHLGPEKEQPEHVEQEVEQSGMAEHVGEELPYVQPLENEPRDQCCIVDAVSAHHVEEKNRHIGQYQSKSVIFVGVPQGAAYK